MPRVSTVAATVVTWYAGVEGGAALAAVLAGEAEPAGRLPFAVPTAPDDLAPFDRDATTATYDMFHGQWLLERDGVAPHFPFGWGLGYGTAQLDGASPVADGSAVEVTVTNTGQRATSTVVFVRGGVPESEHERPARRLVGFRRVVVEAGATVGLEVGIDWTMLDLRLDGHWTTEPGTYVLDVGRYAGDPGAIELTVERR